MENARKRVNVRLCNNGSKAEKKLISKPNFKDRTIYSETLVAFHMSKTVLSLNKPIVVEPALCSRRLGRFYPLIPPRRTGNPLIPPHRNGSALRFLRAEMTPLSDSAANKRQPFDSSTQNGHFSYSSAQNRPNLLRLPCLLSVFALLAVIGSFITALEYYTKEKFPKDQKCKPFFNCFCIFTNGEKILNTTNSEGQFPCLHGIRFLSINWVILIHTYTLQIPFI
ncbi:hypothetical protein AVEN_153202-1, partial [Araneus ventricosus]